MNQAILNFLKKSYQSLPESTQSQVASGMGNLKEFGKELQGAFTRSYDLFPSDIKADLLKKGAVINKLQSDYAINIPKYEKAYQKLSTEDKRKVLSAIYNTGSDDTYTHGVLDTLLGEGAGRAYQDLTFNYAFDPLITNRPVLNKKYIPGLSSKAKELKGLTENEFDRAVGGSGVVEEKAGKSLQDNLQGLLTLLSRDPNYNLYTKAHKKLIRNLNDYEVLGRAVDPESIVSNVDELGRTYYTPMTKGEMLLPAITYYAPGSIYDRIRKYTTSTKTLPKSAINSIEKTVAHLAGSPVEKDPLDSIATALQYSTLANNPGTVIRSFPEIFKTTASNTNLLEAAKSLYKDKELRNSIVGTAAPTRPYSTEFGKTTITQGILPDFAELADANQKGLTLLANSMQYLDDLNKPNLKADLVEYYKARGSDAETLRQEVLKEHGVDLIDAMAHGVSEIDRAVARTSPANARGVLASGLGHTFRFIDQPLQEAAQNFKSIKEGYFGGGKDSVDINARRKANAALRTAGFKTALFGPTGLVAADVLDVAKPFMDSKSQEELEKSKQRLSMLGLVNTPAAMLGFDTSKLVNPVVAPLPIIESNPIISTGLNLLGQGEARSEVGKLKAGVSSGVSAAGALARLVAPSSPVAEVLSALNPSITGRAFLEVARAAGMSPDSERPFVYKLGDVEKTQGLQNLLGIPLGTTPDYRDRVLGNG